MRLILAVAILAATSLSALPARAEVSASSDSGFVVSGSADTSASPAAVWQALVRPQDWWSSAHTWSGDAANLTLDPRGGGCFCEMLPAVLPDGTAGSVRHMEVVHSLPQALLVMRGSLGPLQGEALTGVLTISLVPGEDGGGTQIAWTYVVGGYARFPLPEIAPAVDGVIAEQMSRLQAHAGGA